MPIVKSTLVVANMRTTEPFFSAFIVEVWNSTRTTKITGPIRVSGVWDAALGAYKQKEVLFFKGLTRGVVYSLRAAVATSHGGPVSAWTAWIDETAGDTTAPSSTYTPTWTAIANGAICSVAVSGAASDLDRYEWYGNTTGIAPSASTPSNWPNTPKDADIKQTFTAIAGDTIYAWIRGVDTSGNRQAWQSLSNSAIGTVAPAPTSTPNAPSWVGFTGQDGIFHFAITPGASALTTLEHEIQIASDSGFTADLLTLVLGGALTKDLRMPSVTRYARTRSRYASSGFSAYVNYGAPTAVTSGHPLDDASPGSFDPADPRLGSGIRQQDAGGTPRTIFRIADHNLDDVGDGSTYGRVLGARITLGVPYVYQGEWVPSTSYLKGDEVAYPSVAAGNIYACMVANSDAVWTVAHWLLIGPASVDQVADGSTYARTTPNQRDGGGRGYTGLNASGDVNRDIPGTIKVVGRSEGLSTTLASLNASGKLLTADDIAADGSTYKRITANQQTGGERAYAAIDADNIVVAAGVDFSRGYTNKTLDNVADGSTYARTTPNQRDGGGRGYTGLNASGDVNRDIPGTIKVVGRSEGLSTTLASLNASGKLLTADDIAADGSTYKRITANQQTGGERAYAAIDADNIVVAAGVDFSRGYTNKTLDNVADGTRAAWDSGTQKTAAVDSAGNILLKNVEVVNGSTSGPVLTCDGTYQTVTDLSITITTNGNQLYLSFATGFSATDGFSAYMVYFALFRDTTRVSPEYGIQATDSMQYTAMGVYIDSPTAASHTFTVKCKASTGVHVTLVGTQRSFSAIELG